MKHLRPRAPSATLVIALVIASLLPRAVAAQDVTRPSANTRIEEAQSRFKRGVELHAEGDFSGALVELTRTYELAPNFRILFNLGQISYQRRDYAGAVEHFSRYLNEGGDQIPPSRRLEIEGDLIKLRQRVGYVGIQVADSGFDVIIDDADKGPTPLPTPVLLNVGRHRIELVAASGERQVRIVDLPGGQTLWLKFKPPVPQLNERSATAAFAARKPASTSALRDDPPTPPTPPVRSRRSTEKQDDPAGQRRWAPWLAWALTAACAGGAAVTGSMAMSHSFELQRKIDSYPVSQRELDSIRQREHEFALATDGLMLGTAVLSAIALYLTFSGPPRTETKRPSQLANISNMAHTAH
ncbi:MAG: hypothetical protein H7X95_06575 [Deltaproteobacteria bacterium]|nr:hypothetical protein [Deltaproteobacteria bacterium]